MRAVILLAFLMTQSAGFAGINEAKNFYKEKKYSDAVAEATNVLKQDSQNREALQLLFTIYSERKDTSNQLTFGKRYVNAGGQITSEMAWNLANIAFQIKDYHSIVIFSKLYNSMKADDHSNYNLLGVAYFYLQQYKPSVIALKTALVLRPNEPIYAANLARSYEMMEHYEKAAEFYKLSLKYDPGFKRSAISLKRVEAILQNKR